MKQIPLNAKEMLGFRLVAKAGDKTGDSVILDAKTGNKDGEKLNTNQPSD